ncbi:MAG TPA: glycosyltransferase family 9 protein [Gemmatimonadaceae bacterium]|nr:glycosyltransferase family 9 protein [Gemmatimonadaceae bacterium]
MDLRKVEIAWRGFWMRLLAALLPGRRQTQLPPPTDPDYRVLVIRYERIGDMIMATSLIRNIANALPARKVDVLATPTTAPVLERNPYVGRVLTLDRRSLSSYWDMMKRLRRSSYKVMVDGRINNPPIFTSTPLLMLAGRAPFRVGAGGDRKPRIYNVSVPEWNRSDHYIDGSKRLVIPFGVDPAHVDWQPELFMSQEETRAAETKWEEARALVASAGTAGTAKQSKCLLVNLSASEPKRRWPDGKFIATLQTVRARFPSMPIVVMGLPREWSSVQKVASAVGALPVPTPNLRDAFALVQTSDLVFTPDTSISHAASAFRKPSLVLLKREHKPYAPYNTPGEIVAWNEEEIQQLPHERVAKALDKLLTEFGGN